MDQKMNLLIVSNLFFLAIFLHTVASDDTFDQSQCIDEYKTMTKQPIDDITGYCKGKNCIIKCCPENEILNHKGACTKAKTLKRVYSKVNYAKESLYSYDGSKLIVTKESFNDLERVYNTLLSNDNCTFDFIGEPFYILEDGTLKTNATEYKKLTFCVDYRVHLTRNKDKTVNVDLKFIYRISTTTESIKDKFTVIGMWISCFFMLLVLAIYSALPHLHKIVGMMLMAYVSTLFVTYMMRAFLLIYISKFSTYDCKIYTPVMYFFIISSFFWLNIMSFDIWWTFRGTRKCREIHRRGEFVKFCWYGLFAWGTPLLLTIGAVLVDHFNENNDDVVRPHFEFCLADDLGIKTYQHIPIGVIMGINVLLFLMTTYNICLIKYRVCKNPNSRKSKNDENRFGIYIKLSVMMGVGWVVELLPDLPTWLFIILNFCNCFLGVGIFFLFVFKKSIFIKLCNRFNINNRFVKKLQNRDFNERTSERSSTFKSTFKSQPQDSTNTSTV